MSGILTLSFAGVDSRTAPQSVSLPGAKVGDIVVFSASTGSGFAPMYYGNNLLEGCISVDDQIQQFQSGNSGDMSGYTVIVFLVRP